MHTIERKHEAHVIKSSEHRRFHTMPKKFSELGQRRKKGSDKQRRTYELYGKCRPTRAGEYTTYTTHSGANGAAGARAAASQAVRKQKKAKRTGRRG